MFGAVTSELPQGFSQLKQLQYLTLTSCGLTSLPTVVVGMSALRLLKVNINRLQVRQLSGISREPHTVFTDTVGHAASSSLS